MIQLTQEEYLTQILIEVTKLKGFSFEYDNDIHVGRVTITDNKALLTWGVKIFEPKTYADCLNWLKTLGDNKVAMVGETLKEEGK
jgi:hypothetical protein